MSSIFKQALKAGKFKLLIELTAPEMITLLESEQETGIKLREYFDDGSLQPSKPFPSPKSKPDTEIMIYEAARFDEVAAFIHIPRVSKNRIELERHLELPGLDLNELRYEHLDYLFDMEETMSLTDLTNASLRKFIDDRTHPTKRLYIQDLYLFHKHTDGSGVRELIDLITDPYQGMLKEVIILSNAANKNDPRTPVPAIVARYKSIGNTLRDSGYPVRFYHAKPEIRAEIHDRRIFTDNYAVKIENSLSQTKAAQTSTIPTWVGRFAPKSLTWSEMNEHWLSLIHPSNCIEIK